MSRDVTWDGYSIYDTGINFPKTRANKGGLSIDELVIIDPPIGFGY